MARLRHEERRAGREGPSGFPSFQPVVLACDRSIQKNRGVDPNEGSIHSAHMYSEDSAFAPGSKEWLVFDGLLCPG
jgi:hypothetical protein